MNAIAPLQASSPAALAALAEWRAGVARMRELGPPDQCRSDAWQRVCLAATAFLQSDYAAQAAESGWTAVGLFSAHRTMRRTDTQGIVWHLARGLKLVALAGEFASLRTHTGAVLTFARRCGDASEPIVPAWELSRCPTAVTRPRAIAGEES